MEIPLRDSSNSSSWLRMDVSDLVRDRSSFANPRTVWDSITSEEAVGLVATHISHAKHAPISRSIVQHSLLPETPESRSKYPGPRPKEEALGGEWVYRDDNAATHLIRNSLSTGKKTAYELLSMKAPIARWLRDDVTCS